MRNPNMGRPVTNKHNVPARQWARWSNLARKVFNQMYHTMRPARQFVFMHPKASPLPKAQWQTVRWNAAWEAACTVDGGSHAVLVATITKHLP